jgi:uncharacterized protein (UPF0332 family)
VSRSLTPEVYMEKAERALSAARILLRADNPEGACNRAYYAMFDAAHATLLAANVGEADTTIKTHSGLISAFGKHLVQAGLIDAKHGRSFNQVHRLRQLADYTGDPVSVDDATWALDQAEAFVTAIKSQFSIDRE